MQSAIKLQEHDIEYLEYEKDSSIGSSAKATTSKKFPIEGIIAHFESHLIRVEYALNHFGEKCFDVAGKGEVTNETIDVAYSVLDNIENYVDFACADYLHFKHTMDKIGFDKTKIPRQLSSRLDTVEWKFSCFKEKFSREETLLLSHLLSKCTEQQLRDRSV